MLSISHQEEVVFSLESGSSQGSFLMSPLVCWSKSTYGMEFCKAVLCIVKSATQFQWKWVEFCYSFLYFFFHSSQNRREMFRIGPLRHLLHLSIWNRLLTLLAGHSIGCVLSCMLHCFLLFALLPATKIPISQGEIHHCLSFNHSLLHRLQSPVFPPKNQNGLGTMPRLYATLRPVSLLVYPGQWLCFIWHLHTSWLF